MTRGILEVLLVKARGLRDAHCFGKIDPYVLIQYKNQERKSSVARGQGSRPVWNETFKFKVEYPLFSGGKEDQNQNNKYKLILKLMDKDTFSSDDYLGQATIYLGELMALAVEMNESAEIQPQKYRIVNSDQSYSGEIQVGITFTPMEEEEAGGEEFGGWKESVF